MKFCDVCNNMFYISTSKQEGLYMYCKNCNFSKVLDSKTKSVKLSEEYHKGDGVPDDACIMSINYSDDGGNYKQFLTPNIKYDVTLPRVNNIPCPKQCSKEGEREVIYIKYDQVNMRYVYFCCKCEHFWKLD